MLKFPEGWRITPTSPWAKMIHPAYLSEKNSGNGMFYIELSSFTSCTCIAASGEGWEHVSINLTDLRLTSKNKGRTPTWREMCLIKDIFWDKEDTVMQLHPPESDYVNVATNVLHLWRPLEGEIPRPPKIMV